MGLIIFLNITSNYCKHAHISDKGGLCQSDCWGVEDGAAVLCFGGTFIFGFQIYINRTKLKGEEATDEKIYLFLFGNVFPSAAAAITQIVNAGEVLDGGDVHTVVTQRVYGTTKNFTVSGNQQVMSGGEAYNSNIFPYGQQNVEKGGVSHNTNVQYYAVQNVNGEAYSSTVESQGIVDVNAGGYAQDTVVNGGMLVVSSGAEVKGTVLNGGRENVSGTDEAASVKSGLQQILNGGVSKYASVSGGLQLVEAGGSSIGAVVFGRGRQKVWGTAEQTSVQKGGIVDVMEGGSVRETAVSGGELVVNPDAFSYNTQMSSGTLSVFGTDTDSIISGGVQQVESGGIALNSQVRSGGVQSVFSGGKAENTTIDKGGWLFLFSGGSLAGTTKVTEGVVTVVGSNNISDMQLQNAAVNIPFSHDFQRCSLTV